MKSYRGLVFPKGNPPKGHVPYQFIRHTGLSFSIQPDVASPKVKIQPKGLASIQNHIQKQLLASTDLTTPSPLVFHAVTSNYSSSAIDYMLYRFVFFFLSRPLGLPRTPPPLPSPAPLPGPLLLSRPAAGPSSSPG